MSCSVNRSWCEKREVCGAQDIVANGSIEHEKARSLGDREKLDPRGTSAFCTSVPGNGKSLHLLLLLMIMPRMGASDRGGGERGEGFAMSVGNQGPGGRNKPYRMRVLNSI